MRHSIAHSSMFLPIAVDLGVTGDQLQRAGQVLHKHLLRFLQCVDVCVKTVTRVRQLLHQYVIVLLNTQTIVNFTTRLSLRRAA